MANKLLRINKFLAQAGAASRRGADALVAAGRVRVNGRVVDAAGFLVDPGKDQVWVDGRIVGAPEPLRHIVMNKPAGYITSARDPQGRPTVLDIVPVRTVRLYPVGRLDYDSEGLLFLMNDGKLAFRLTHPRYEVPKVYEVDLDRPADEPSLDAIRSGLTLEDGPTAPAEVVLRRGGGGTRLTVTIHEGRQRQVRRMFAAVGCQVTRLARTGFGGIGLGNLKVGAWRDLTHAEVLKLRNLVGLKNG